MRLEVRTREHAQQRPGDAHLSGHELSAAAVRAGGWQLACDRVCRFFGSRAVLREASFRLGAGELVALFGPNGAGKSTLLHILAGGLKPTRGTVTVGGERAGSEAARRQTGLLAHQSLLHPALTVRENLVFFARLYGMAAPAAAAAAALAAVRGEALAPCRAGELSQGMRQKAALARCLLHQPRLLLLDEPFSGLDTQAVDEMRRRFAALRDAGLTLLVTSHSEALVRDLATGVLHLDRGRIVPESAQAAGHV